MANENEVLEEEVLEETKPVESEVKAEETKPEKQKKEKVKKVKKEKKESKIKKRLKETASELKKVSWPTFKETVKKTGVVLGVVIFFSVILFAFDYILSTSLTALAGGEIPVVKKWVSVGLACAIVACAIAWLTIWLIRRKNRR